MTLLFKLTCVTSLLVVKEEPAKGRALRRV